MYIPCIYAAAPSHDHAGLHLLEQQRRRRPGVPVRVTVTYHSGGRGLEGRLGYSRRPASAH